jgi:hypothetical protein
MRDSVARSEMLTIVTGYEKLARRAEAAMAVVPATSTDLYRSANDDRWRLITDTGSGRRVVRHEPNPLLVDRSQRPRWKTFSP